MAVSKLEAYEAIIRANKEHFSQSDPVNQKGTALGVVGSAFLGSEAGLTVPEAEQAEKIGRFLGTQQAKSGTIRQ